MQNQYLYHYGVQGMRWGVRKSPAQRKAALQRYKDREKTILLKRQAKENERSEKRVSKAMGKVNYRRETGSQRQVERAEKRYKKVRTKAYVNSEITKKEIAKVSNMKYADMQAEKREVGKTFLTSALVTVGTKTLATVAGLPVYVVGIPDPTAAKTNNRVNQQTRFELQVTGGKKADDDLRKKK